MAVEPTKSNLIEQLKGGDVQAIVQLPPLPGKNLLATKLGIPPYNDPNDPQKAPFINYIYDNIIFAAEKGFPWPHICLVVRFAHEYLKCILAEGHTMSQVIIDFKKNSDILSPLSDRHQQQYTDFMFDTILTHYHLYKYCFSHLREIVKPKDSSFQYPVTKEVHVPPEPLPMSQGYILDVWEYRDKLKAIETREKEAVEKLKETQENKEKPVSTHKTVKDLENLPRPLDKMSLVDMIKDVLLGHMEEKQAALCDQAEIITQDLSFKLEKTALPRPAVLGEPPKWKPKTPVATTAKGKDNNNNNKDSKSRKSSARSSKSPGRQSSKSSAKSKK